MNALRVPIVGAVLAAAALAAYLPSGIQAQQSVTVTLAPENNSGISGRAVLTPDGAGTKVELELQNAPGPHPAHIHAGSCGPTLNPAPAFPLSAVNEGESETTVNATLQQILASPHAINVHKSPQEASVYVACGNITAAAAAAPAAQPSPPAAPAKPAAPAAPAAPATKPAAAPAPAAQPAQAPKPAAAPAQVAKPAASPPAALPRTGEAAGASPNILLAVVAGVALIGVGAFAIRRRRSVV